jgi:signal transduction histidine kinase
MSDDHPSKRAVSGAELPESSSALIAHIQNAAEQQKALLARELHDELGGLLVGAVMDLAWAEQHATATGELKQKLLRARQTLSTAIDLKRRLIEELRPTLLDNVGLFAALRWHVQSTCKHADLDCIIDLPEEERRFLPNIPITLFRIVQEAFALIVTKPPAASAEFSVVINPKSLTLKMSRKHVDQSIIAPTPEDEHALSAIKHRTELLNGDFSHISGTPGSTHIMATFPLEKLVA